MNKQIQQSTKYMIRRRTNMNLISTALTLISTLLLSLETHSAYRIVGGDYIDMDEAPWQVAIGLAGGDIADTQFCGGSIIDNNWILTAAHCFLDNEESPQILTEGDFIVVIGEPVLSRASSPNEYSFNVADNLHIHPGWDYSDSFKNDIALIHLDSPMDLSACGNDCEIIEWVTPSNEETVAPLSTEALVSGWGGTRAYTPDINGDAPPGFTQILSDDLKGLTVYISDCEEGSSYEQYFICASAINSFEEDSCQGDSGGPLVVRKNDGTGFLQAGIVSNGVGCASGYPGSYTRLASYSNWINQTLGRLTSADDTINGNETTEDNTDDGESKSENTLRTSRGGALGISMLVVLIFCRTIRRRKKELC